MSSFESCRLIPSLYKYLVSGYIENSKKDLFINIPHEIALVCLQFYYLKENEYFHVENIEDAIHITENKKSIDLYWNSDDDIYGYRKVYGSINVIPSKYLTYYWVFHITGNYGAADIRIGLIQSGNNNNNNNNKIHSYFYNGAKHSDDTMNDINGGYNQWEEGDIVIMKYCFDTLEYGIVTDDEYNHPKDHKLEILCNNIDTNTMYKMAVELEYVGYYTQTSLQLIDCIQE